MKQYLDYLDLAKGFGIILVIMGHSLFPLHIAIDIFHMPLFFFISGITFSINNNVTISERIFKKIDRIFIPLIFFSLLSSVFEFFLKPVSNGDFNEPLWFLKVIFTSLIIYYVIIFNFNKYKNIIIIFLTLLAFIFAVKKIKVFLDIDLALFSLSFIHLGYLLKNNYKKIKKNQTIFVLLLSIIFYSLGLYYSIHLGVKGGYYFRNYKYSLLLFYITSISGIFIVLTFSKIINKINVINYLGKNSLIILCVHFPLIERLNIIVSKMDLYNSGSKDKVILGLFVYLITISFSVICIEFFRKYIPKLTGFSSNFKINT